MTEDRITDTPPAYVRQEIERLNAQLDEVFPPKKLDKNLIIGTWNIRAFGDLTHKWASTEDDSPRRDLQSVLDIAQIVARFDVIAIQEVRANICALRNVLKVLGDHWSMILTDVTRGDAGNGERMAFLFDTRRVKLSGLASELVVPQEQLASIEADALQKQFARTPYAVSFKSGDKTFVLVTLHILYGDRWRERIPELKAIARWMADWATDINAYDQNLIALGDFNIDKRGDLLHQTFLSEGLHIAEDLAGVTRSIFDETKFYDHIAWFTGANNTPKLSMEYIKGGNFDFVGHTLADRDLSRFQLSWCISDHYPLWAEFAV